MATLGSMKQSPVAEDEQTATAAKKALFATDMDASQHDQTAGSAPANRPRRDSIAELATSLAPSTLDEGQNDLALPLADALRALGDMNLIRSNRPGFYTDGTTQQNDVEMNGIRTTINTRWGDYSKNLAMTDRPRYMKLATSPRERQRAGAEFVRKMYAENGFKIAYCGETSDILQALLMERNIPPSHLISLILKGRIASGEAITHSMLLYSSKGFPGDALFTPDEIIRYAEANMEACCVLDAWNVHKFVAFEKGAARDDFLACCNVAMQGVHPKFVPSTLALEESDG